MYNRQTTEELIKSEFGLAKMVECPKDVDIHLEYIVNQLLDPQNNRPCDRPKPFNKLKAGANRNVIFNPSTGVWENRMGRWWDPKNKAWLVWRDYNKRIRGLPKQTPFTKPTSLTSLPSHGKIKLINYIFKNPDSCVVFIFDERQCYINPKYIFDADVNTDAKWWIENNSTRGVSYAKTYEYIKNTLRSDVRRNVTSKLNEIFAGVSQVAFSGVAAPSDTLFARLNTLRVGYYIKIRLTKPKIDFLIITPETGVIKYTDTQQAKDIYEALGTTGDVFDIACKLLHYSSVIDKIVRYLNNKDKYFTSQDIASKFLSRIIKAKHYDVALEILSRCPNINIHHADYNGYTLFHYATMQNQPELLVKLNEYAHTTGLRTDGLIQLNLKNHRSPLAIALYNYLYATPTQSLSIIEMVNCLERLRDKTDSRQSASFLLDFTRAGWDNSALDLIENSIQINLDLKDYNTGNTALHYAVMHYQLSLVTQLLDIKANASIKNNNQRTPLSIALYNKAFHLVYVILERQPSSFNALTKNEVGSLLLYCMRTKQYSYANTLLKDAKEIYVRFKDEATQNTSLHYAVMYDRSYEAEILCAYPRIINDENREGYTPLDLAFQMQKYDLAEKMAKVSVIEISENLLSKIILNFLVRDKPEIVKFLLENSPYPRVGGYDSLTHNSTVHYAVLKGYLELVRQFCLIGEKINLKNKQNQTPLSLALSFNQPIQNEIAKSILELSSDQLTSYEIVNCISKLIKRKTITVDFLKTFNTRLNNNQTLFYIYTLFNCSNNSCEILESVDKVKGLGIPFFAQEEGRNLLHKLAKTRILRLSLECERTGGDINTHPSFAGVSEEHIKLFLNKHSSSNIFTFFLQYKFVQYF